MWSKIYKDFSQNILVVFDRNYYVKGKTIPLQPWTGPEGSRRLKLPDFGTVGT
jgi:hypothetical protein